MRARFATIALMAGVFAMILTVNFGATPLAAGAPAAHNRTIPEGVGCLFLAPSGAAGLGHVGWAFSSPPYWYFGATEGTGQFWIPPGEPTNSWLARGTWADTMNAFASGTNHDKGAGYYKSYTCKIVKNARPDRAYQQALAGADSYLGADNNCLTKSIDILLSYGLPKSYEVKGLYFRGPNFYYNFLPKGYPQWSESHPVVTLQ